MPLANTYPIQLGNKLGNLYNLKLYPIQLETTYPI